MHGVAPGPGVSLFFLFRGCIRRQYWEVKFCGRSTLNLGGIAQLVLWTCACLPIPHKQRMAGQGNMVCFSVLE